jgi:hypothetical protein
MTKDSLQKFFDAVHSKQSVNRVQFPQWYEVIELTDDCFARAGTDIMNPKPFTTTALLGRCQYAYKAAAGLALAGQVNEAFVMLRSVLEYAGYCLTIYENPSLQRVFLDRHSGESEMKAQKLAFQIKTVRASVGRHDAALADTFDQLYQRTIDFGGHPNPYGSVGTTVFDELDGETAMTVVAFSNDPLIVEFGLRSTAQAGLTALFILLHVFKEKFELLGIRQVIDVLKKVL